MINSKYLRIALAAAAISLLPAQALAVTALAVGVTGNPREGIAIGFAYNFDSASEAKQAAVRRCRAFKTAPKAARRCKFIGSTRKGCVATAFDPKDDSPGMGWAVADTRAEAQSRAMSACRRAAGARRSFCKLNAVRCEGDTPPKSDRR